MTENGGADQFLDTIEAALAESHPLALLQMASTIIASLDPERTRFAALATGVPVPSGPALADFCQSLLTEASVPSLALATVIGELAGDDLLRARIRRELLALRKPVPGWIRRLDQVRVSRVVAMTDVLGDGQNIVLEALLPSDRALSVVAYVDHNMGTVVKDAFVIPEPLAAVRSGWDRAHADRPDLAAGSTVDPMTLPDARARLEHAVEKGHHIVPPFETESWPQCEPLLAWLLRSMPEGGEGYPYTELSDKDLAVVTRDFLASRWAADFDDDSDFDLAELLFLFAATTADGNPLRWSMVTVEVLLMDWLPSNGPEVRDLGRATELLRAIIRFSHQRSGLNPFLTRETLAAVDLWEPRFFELLEQMDDDDDDSNEEVTLGDYYAFILDSLADQVGGKVALMRLDTTPLASHPFDWSGIDNNIVPRVTEVLNEVDVAVPALFDDDSAAELGAACRRFLSRVASADPAIFRRKGSVKTAAAAIVWVVAKANELIGPYRGRVQAQHLLAHFGISGSVSQRADPMLRAIGANNRYGAMGVGDAALLTAVTRRGLLASRDEMLGLLLELGDPDTED